MSYPEMRYCKHCQKDHPFNEKFWYLNGGKLRKCKAHYGPYERKRQQEKRDRLKVEASHNPT